MISLKYTSNNERRGIIQSQETVGLVMLSDDYVAGWKQGDAIAGMLTFDIPVILPSRSRTRLDDLNDKLMDDTINFSELKEYLRLQR